MSERVMNTGAVEAIRIAEKYLPKAGVKRQQELAMEIADAIGLCEAEFVEEMTMRLRDKFGLSET